MATAYFYSNKSSNNTVSKNTTFIKKIDVKLVQGCSMKNPQFLITSENAGDIVDCNYFYLDCFRRYYNITDRVYGGNNLVQIIGERDVLGSFANEIKSLQCLVERQEFVFNDYLIDTNVINRVGTITEKRRVGSVGTTNSFCLTVTGGN